MADYQIFEVIKVDYISTDIEKTKQKLFEEAFKIIENKKELYLSKTKSKIIGVPYLTEEYESYLPKMQYKSYDISESSDYNDYSQETKKLIKRKSTTLYYDGIQPANFDKIINISDPEVSIQYVLTLSATYTISKKDKDKGK